MRARSVVVLCLSVFLVVSCTNEAADERPSAGSTTSPVASPTFDEVPAIIETDDGPVMLTVEVAETEPQWRVGLMHRESLPDDSGMVFFFFKETTGGFWMKNTLIPLSIAFFDEHGKILRIMDMKPCKRDPCKVYDPGVPYWGALEVNQGAFERWGVSEGDVIEINR